MERTPPPLLGFNNNVRHRGRVFHIQTEDSGVRHARVVTHLFADGGRIVRTTRTDYSDYLGRHDMVSALRHLMKEQHKSMFLALRAGELDSVIDEVFCRESLGPQAENRSLPPQQRSLPPDRAVPRSTSMTPLPLSLDLDDDTEIQPKKVVAVSAKGAADRASAAPGGAADSTSPPARSSASERPPAQAPTASGTRRAVAPGPPVRRDPPSIFGGVAAHESLDDVILSYLEDDEGDAEKGSS